MVIFYIDNIPVSYNILQWFFENNSDTVSETYKQEFLELKNTIEGWKKGTHVRQNKFSNSKSEIEKVKENLSLYLNQLSNSNYNIIENKICKEIDNSSESVDMLLELILLNGIPQENNLLLLGKLLQNLKLDELFLKKLEEQLKKSNITKIDQSNYDQLCATNRINLIYKNGYIFIGNMYSVNNSSITTQQLENYIKVLNKKIFLSDDKELSEKYLEVYIEFIRKVEKKLKDSDEPFHRQLIEELNIWKMDKLQFTNRARFSILDFIESI
jgi:hypothetical protein